MRSEPQPDGLEMASTTHLPGPVLREIVATDAPETIVGILLRSTLPRSFRPAIEQWASTEDLATLGDELASGVTFLAQSRMRNDPLGIGVPAGFLWSKDQEARNLRLIGSIHIHGLDRSEVEQRVVIT